jgi:hypothetical protein
MGMIILISCSLSFYLQSYNIRKIVELSKRKQFCLPLNKLTKMKAVTVFKNEENDHKLVQIDIDELADNDELIEELFDFLTIELRRNEETVSWEDVKKQIESAK